MTTESLHFSTLDTSLLIYYNGHMELTDRQEQILNSLIKEYLDSAEPISSDLLSRLLSSRGSSIKSGKKRLSLDVSPATIRNELQELTELGYVAQPHTSAGRVPTEKAYHYFVEIIFSENKTPDLTREINQAPTVFAKSFGEAKQKIERELKLAQELTKSLQDISSTLSYTRLQDKNGILQILKIIGPSQSTYDRNIDIMKRLLEELENF